MKLLRLPGNKVLSINNSAAIFQHKLNSQQASNLWYDAINTYQDYQSLLPDLPHMVCLVVVQHVCGYWSPSALTQTLYKGI